MAGEIRQGRVSNAIKRFVSSLLLTEFGDSPASTITIYKVTVAPDLRMAKIYYSIFGSTENKAVQDFLVKQTKNIRFKLASHLKNIKFAPDIQFIYDDSIERAIRIEKILDSIKSDKGTENESQ